MSKNNGSSWFHIQSITINVVAKPTPKGFNLNQFWAIWNIDDTFQSQVVAAGIGMVPHA